VGIGLVLLGGQNLKFQVVFKNQGKTGKKKKKIKEKWEF